MEPALDSRDNIVFVNIMRWKIFHRLNRDDIIVASNPFKPGYQIVKRVLYLPGETAVSKSRQGDNISVEIPENHVWVEGDNKNNSRDSREFGPISMNLVQGVVTHRLWPYNKIERLF
mmetsp:Transcript_13582/g.15228  ORF Transcript_13582/g.15228 Transcript_13582/m.15228 type:complete len:117 (+) Transcript_13582:158-508(+)